MSIASDIRKVREYLTDPAKWNKDGDYFKGGDRDTGCGCVFGVLDLVLGVGSPEDSPAGEFLDQHSYARNDCRAIDFNDDPATTHADMLAFLDSAIAAAEAAE